MNRGAETKTWEQVMQLSDSELLEQLAPTENGPSELCLQVRQLVARVNASDDFAFGRSMFAQEGVEHRDLNASGLVDVRLRALLRVRAVMPTEFALEARDGDMAFQRGMLSDVDQAPNIDFSALNFSPEVLSQIIEDPANTDIDSKLDASTTHKAKYLMRQAYADKFSKHGEEKPSVRDEDRVKFWSYLFDCSSEPNLKAIFDLSQTINSGVHEDLLLIHGAKTDPVKEMQLLHKAASTSDVTFKKWVYFNVEIHSYEAYVLAADNNCKIENRNLKARKDDFDMELVRDKAGAYTRSNGAQTNGASSSGTRRPRAKTQPVTPTHNDLILRTSLQQEIIESGSTHPLFEYLIKDDYCKFALARNPRANSPKLLESILEFTAVKLDGQYFAAELKLEFAFSGRHLSSMPKILEKVLADDALSLIYKVVTEQNSASEMKLLALALQTGNSTLYKYVFERTPLLTKAAAKLVAENLCQYDDNAHNKNLSKYPHLTVRRRMAEPESVSI